MGQSTTSARDARNEPVMVHASFDFNEIALIKSMLTSADIEFFVEGDSQTGWGPVFAQCPIGRRHESFCPFRGRCRSC